MSKRTTPADKLIKKREMILSRTAGALQINEDQARALLSMGRHQSLRVNTLLSGNLILELEPFAWFKDGYKIADAREYRDSELVTEGKLFIQNAASWLPVLALDPQAGEEILDVCAAPGGKTSHIAAATNSQARITANDNSRIRLAKMRHNFERLGVQNIETTLYDAAQIARKLEGRQFDKILLDAPCSGEGMMRFDRDKDFTMWSVAQIKRLQQLQKRVITQAWQLLKPGGTLVYSTCTMAPEENEAVIDYLLRTHEDVQIEPLDMELPNRVQAVVSWNGKEFSPEVQGCMRLVPSRDIEAFFVCKLKKLAEIQ